MKRIISSLILLTFIGLSKAQPQFYDGAIDSASKAVMAKAEQDIEKYRKGNFTLMLVDTNGKPVKNVKINAELDKHQFNFGTNLFRLSSLPDTSPLKETALQTIKDIFNEVVVCDYWFNPLV